MRVVISSSLAIRDKPTIKGEIVGRILRGEFISPLEEQRGWFKIEKNKWVHGAFTRKVPSIQKVTTIANSLNVRSGPSTSYPRVGTYPYGTTVEVFENRQGWFLTNKGWIAGNYTKEYTKNIELDFPYEIRHIPYSSNRRPGKTAGNYNFSFEGITIHNTANPNSTALNERNWLVNPNNTRTASWHIAVDENMAVEAIPLNELAWHAGDFKGNNTTIGIEICEPNHSKAMHNAIKLVAKLLQEQNWTTERVYTHQYWSGKFCPNIILREKLWDYFINSVNIHLNA